MPWGFSTTTDEVIEGVDLSGRLAVVTGASTGLGRETARALASAGASVVLAVRDVDKGAEVLRSLPARPGASHEVQALDLADLDSVRAFAATFLGQHPRLQLLINNAGVMATPFERTAQGFERQFGTNHLGHFLLTVLLAPALVAGAPARVVNLSSGGHRASDILWDDPNFERTPYDKFVAYGQSKTANILFTVELERRLGPRGVHAWAVHPGMVGTELGRYMTRDDFAALVERAKRTGGALPERKPIPAGAATSVWAAVAPELEGRGGGYLEDCSISDQHAPWALDPERASRLWAMSETFVGATLPEGD